VNNEQSGKRTIPDGGNLAVHVILRRGTAQAGGDPLGWGRGGGRGAPVVLQRLKGALELSYLLGLRNSRKNRKGFVRWERGRTITAGG